MNKLKRCTAMICLISMIMGSTFAIPALAEEAGTKQQTTSEETKTTEVFTIDKAIEYAKKNSYTIESLKNSVTAAENAENSAKVTYKNIRNNEYYSSSGSPDYVGTGYYYKAAQYQNRAAQRSLISAEYTLESDVETAFYDYINSKKKTEYAQDDLNKAKERYSFAKKKYDLGTISKLELESFALAEVSAQNSLNTAQRNENSKLMNFKLLINYPLEAELVLMGEFTRKEMDQTSVSEAMEKYNNTIEKANLDESFELATEKYNTEMVYYTSGRYEFYEKKAEYANTEGQYVQAGKQAKISIQNAYDQMLNIYETLSYLDRSLEQAKAQEDAAKLRYQQGTITANDYLDVVSQVSSLKNTIADTELGAWQSVMSYRKLFDCTNTVFKN